MYKIKERRFIGREDCSGGLCLFLGGGGVGSYGFTMAKLPPSKFTVQSSELSFSCPELSPFVFVGGPAPEAGELLSLLPHREGPLSPPPHAHHVRRALPHRCGFLLKI